MGVYIHRWSCWSTEHAHCPVRGVNSRWQCSHEHDDLRNDACNPKLNMSWSESRQIVWSIVLLSFMNSIESIEGMCLCVYAWLKTDERKVLVVTGIVHGQLREEPSGWSNWNGFHAYNCLMAPACLGIITHGKRKGGAPWIMEQCYCNSLETELLEIKLLVFINVLSVLRELLEGDKILKRDSADRYLLFHNTNFKILFNVDWNCN